MQNKSEMRAALLENGIRTRGMTDEQIKAEFDKLGTPRQPEPAPRKQPTKRKPKFKQPEGLKPEAPEAEPEPEFKPDSKAAEAFKSESEAPAPALKPLKTDGITAAIAAAIADSMQAPEIDEAKIVELIKAHSQAPTRIEYEVNITRPSGDTKKIEGAHHILKDVLDVAAIAENVFLAGPAACGKTTLAAQVAEALGFDFQYIGSISDEFRLSGFIDANGTYHETSFYKACTYAERGFDGCVFLLDEADASLPAALLAANAAFENGYFEFPTGRVEFDKSKVFFMCAANTLGKGANRQYTGRFPLDDAFLNRFERMTMDYDMSVELAMAENAWLEAGGDKSKVDIARDFAHEVIALRRQLDEKGILALVTPRHTRRGAGLLARGWKLDKVRKGLYVDLNKDQMKTLGL